MLHGIHLAVKPAISHPNEFVNTDMDIDGEFDDDILEETHDSVLKPKCHLC